MSCQQLHKAATMRRGHHFPAALLSRSFYPRPCQTPRLSPVADGKRGGGGGGVVCMCALVPPLIGSCNLDAGRAYCGDVTLLKHARAA